MSEIKVNSIKGVGASAAAITVNNTDGTCTANITNRTNKNVIQNGAFLISQRGTSSTTNGFGSVDRFAVYSGGADETPTHAQVDVAAGTTPYTLGFRKALKITNGNQTSGAGADDYIQARTVLEAQDIANSGWNYLSTSSSITISFWVKSSVAQNFYGNLWTQDGTEYNYIFETGSLSADTWTKVTKTIIGNSNLTFNNDNGAGLRIQLVAFMGTNKTGSVSLNTWAAFSGSTITPDMTSTWYTTNDATFELTGVQLEVGSVATDFEHRSYGQELALCQRYCQRIRFGTYRGFNFIGRKTGSDTVVASMAGFPAMRASATSTVTDLAGFRLDRLTDGSTNTPTSLAFTHENYEPYTVLKVTAGTSSYSTGDLCAMTNTNTAGDATLDAEL